MVLDTLHYSLNGAALWLMGFGLLPAIFSFITNFSMKKKSWACGALMSLVGAIGVFGLQDAISFFIAWELMSFGTAIMLLGENSEPESASAVLFMLAILEVGAIALIIAFLLLSNHGTSVEFNIFAIHAKTFSTDKQILIGILLLIGFGAKLGLLPFYEWLPKAYAAGSGATGALASGIILNAAFFGLMRGLFSWLPGILTSGFTLGIIIILVASITAVLTILNAFQQSDWRKLLSFSSAENAAISILMLGVALLFQHEALFALAGLAATVALIHLAGHSLAKSALFFTADGVHAATGNYVIQQNGLLKTSGWIFGVGALFAAMSLCAMPPQAGFVSEWFVFQTIFHGIYLHNTAERLTIIAGGVGMALTAAIALATFVKLFGVGLLGAHHASVQKIPVKMKSAVFILGVCILILSVGLFFWMHALSHIMRQWFLVDSTSQMHTHLILVPLSANFAFISPTLLVIVMPLLAIIPVILIFSYRHFSIQYVRVWSGGTNPGLKTLSTTSLTFSNALRNFYRFAYMPKQEIKREYEGKPYFMKSISFREETTPVFTHYVFQPIVRFISTLSDKIRLLQSGNLNFYNLIIGLLVIVILCCVF